MEDRSFSWALRQIKRGRRLQRSGWGDKGMFVFFVPNLTFQADRTPLLDVFPRGTEIKYHSHIDMRTADGQVVPWVASQTDLLADDWVEAEWTNR